MRPYLMVQTRVLTEPDGRYYCTKSEVAPEVVEREMETLKQLLRENVEWLLEQLHVRAVGPIEFTIAEAVEGQDGSIRWNVTQVGTIDD